MAVVSGILTVAVLIFGEIVPKTIGSRFYMRCADVVALSIRAMLFVTYPVVIVLGSISRLLGEAGEARTTREDVLLFAKQGHADGAMQDVEALALKKLLNLRSTPVTKISPGVLRRFSMLSRPKA